MDDVFVCGGKIGSPSQATLSSFVAQWAKSFESLERKKGRCKCDGLDSLGRPSAVCEAFDEVYLPGFQSAKLAFLSYAKMPMSACSSISYAPHAHTRHSHTEIARRKYYNR
jgi:hypothetical protein